MNARFSKGNVLRTAIEILVLAGLACVALLSAAPTRVHSKPSRVGFSAPLAGAAAQDSSGNPPAPRGQHEGITVHGHWTLEVRNPDGSVAKHVEFENSLVTPTNFPGFSDYGSQVLVALLSGIASVSPSSITPWQMELASLTTGDVTPCADENFFNIDGITGNPGGYGDLGNACDIAAPSVTPPPGTVVFTQDSASSLTSQMTISGSTKPAVQGGTIDTVYTLTALNEGTTINSRFPFTSATLQPQGSSTCGGTNQPPCAVGVGVGQTVSATVVISFQ